MATIVLAARLVLAGVFAVAGVAKLLDRPGTRQALSEFGAPQPIVSVTAVLLPAAELATAMALVPEPSARWGAVAALILLATFTAGISRALARGSAPNCQCFGQLRSEPAGKGTLARNAVLAALAGVVLVEGPGPALDAWVSDRADSEPVVAAVAAVAVLLGAAGVWLWQDRKRIAAELDAAYTELSAFPPGLPIGGQAPPFALPSIAGEVVTLEGLCKKGRPVALVFVDPGCGPCDVLFPELTRWQGAVGGRLTVVAMSSGTAEQNARLANDEAEVLLQDEAEVMRRYRMHGTPAMVLVSPEGRIASAPASGAIAIESLVRLALRSEPSPASGGRPVTQPA